MKRPSIDLIVLTVVAALSAGLILMTPEIPVLRVISALPLVFILPGYALTAAFFPTRSLDVPERLLFSLGLSLAVTAITGLALHVAMVGLQTKTWAITLATFTLCAGLIAWWRQSRRRTAPIAAPREAPFRPSIREGLLFGLVILVAGAAIYLARMPTPPSGVSGYTLLWMIPANDGDWSNFRVGVDSKEFTPTSYRLQVTVDGQAVKEWPELNLAPGDSWQTSIELQATQAVSGSVEAVLYRLDSPDAVYRHVKLQPKK